MREPHETRQLVAQTRLRIQRDHTYLRSLQDGLVKTQCVLERAIKTYTVSDRLLQKMNGFAFPAVDHKLQRP